MRSTLQYLSLRVIFQFTFLLTTPAVLTAQVMPNERKEWHASWIAHPTAPLREPGVFHFRKTFRLDLKPDHFIVLVSADNRFQLYVNGRLRSYLPPHPRFASWR